MGFTSVLCMTNYNGDYDNGYNNDYYSYDNNSTYKSDYNDEYYKSYNYEYYQPDYNDSTSVSAYLAAQEQKRLDEKWKEIDREELARQQKRNENSATPLLNKNDNYDGSYYYYSGSKKIRGGKFGTSFLIILCGSISLLIYYAIF